MAEGNLTYVARAEWKGKYYEVMFPDLGNCQAISIQSEIQDDEGIRHKSALEGALATNFLDYGEPFPPANYKGDNKEGIINFPVTTTFEEVRVR